MCTVCFLSKLCDIQLNFKFLKKHFSLAKLILNGDKRCLKEENKFPPGYNLSSFDKSGSLSHTAGFGGCPSNFKFGLSILWFFSLEKVDLDFTGVHWQKLLELQN